MRKAVFLDKDGTLIEDVPYSAGAPKFLPGVVQALRRMADAGYALIVITNQSGIAKGLLTRDDVERQRLAVNLLLAEQGITLGGYYICPHDNGCGCICRKPLPGLLHKAAGQMDIDLGQSWMIGDKETDQQAGIAAGCGSIILGRLTMGDAADITCAMA